MNVGVRERGIQGVQQRYLRPFLFSRQSKCCLPFRRPSVPVAQTRSEALRLAASYQNEGARTSFSFGGEIFAEVGLP